jgi:hypothetical protein
VVGEGNANSKSSSLLTGLLSGSIPKRLPTTSNEEINDNNNQTEPEKMETEEQTNKQQVGAEKQIQKNKRKCWNCKVKLELAQRELGQCKCGYVFCLLHRLPEQHNCTYDHKDSGRQEAMQKMVDTGRKKIGRSFHRMDSKA